MFSFKKITFYILLLTVSLRGQTQNETITFDSVELLLQANHMAAAMIQSDYKTLAKYTYPKVVEWMGGEERMISVLTESIEKLKSEGFSFKSVSIGLTSLVVKAGKEIHTLISQTLIINAPGGLLTSNSYLIGISADNGNNWTFVDTAPLNDKENLKAIFPDYNHDLKIPAKKPPVFTKSE